MPSIRKPIPGLFRAVKDPELTGVKATNTYSPGPYGDEMKYFCPDISGASRYARLAYARWAAEGPYTMTSGYLLDSDLTLDGAYVDGGIISVLVQNADLPKIGSADEDVMCINEIIR